MDNIRTQIMTALSSITDVESGVAIPDGMVEEGKTYFGYELQEIYQNSDQDKNYTMEISLTGRLVRRERPGDNTVKILDDALEEIKSVLKSLNFKYSYNDISGYTDGFKKILVKATAKYNELTKELVL